MCSADLIVLMDFTVSFFSSVPLYPSWINSKTFNQCFVQLLGFFLLLPFFSVTVSAILFFTFPSRAYFYHFNFSVGNWNSFTWVAHRKIKHTKKSKIKPFSSPPCFHFPLYTSVLAKTLQFLEGRPDIDATGLNEQQKTPVKSLHVPGPFPASFRAKIPVKILTFTPEQ